MNNTNISWKDIKVLCPQLRLVLKSLFIIIVLDFVISIIVGYFMSDTYHFNRYVRGDDVGENFYDDMTSYYFSDELLIQPNVETGWFNPPNYIDVYKEGSEWDYDWDWNTDSFGAIRNIQKGNEVEVLDGRNAIFVLGSSVMAGWALKQEDRLAGALNSHGYDAINFASIEYVIDQSYALYETKLSQYKPAVIVVGLHNDPEAISGMFAPFRRGSDAGAPYLKPAYHVSEDGSVEKVYPPVDEQKRKDVSEMVLALEKHDMHYDEFAYFKFGFLPLSDLMQTAALWVNREVLGVEKYHKAFELQKYFMEQFIERAKKDGTDVIFVKLETSDELEESIEKPWYKFWYKDLNAIHTELLKNTSMNVLYISDIFKETEQPIDEFYRENDNLHLSAKGCQVLAQKISEAVDRLKVEKYSQ